MSYNTTDYWLLYPLKQQRKRWEGLTNNAITVESLNHEILKSILSFLYMLPSHEEKHN